MSLLPITLSFISENFTRFSYNDEYPLGMTCTLAVSSIAYAIFRSPIFQTISSIGLGMAAGVLVKKALSRYTSIAPFEKHLLSFEERHSYVKPLIALIACISSFCFPIFSAMLAVALGFEAGFVAAAASSEYIA